jgi:hypothetical protein
VTTIEIAHLARWRWRLLEKRATTGFHRDLLVALKTLGADRTAVLGLEVVEGGAGPLLHLTLPRHRLILAGIATPAAAPLRLLAGDPVRGPVVSGAGRYGRAWWLALAGEDGRLTVLGTHLRLLPRPGDPADRDPEPPARPARSVGERQVLVH